MAVKKRNKVPRTKGCQVRECDGLAKGGGRCSKHYYRAEVGGWKDSPPDDDERRWRGYQHTKRDPSRQEFLATTMTATATTATTTPEIVSHANDDDSDNIHAPMTMTVTASATATAIPDGDNGREGTGAAGLARLAEHVDDSTADLPTTNRCDPYDDDAVLDALAAFGAPIEVAVRWLQSALDHGENYPGSLEQDADMLEALAARLVHRLPPDPADDSGSGLATVTPIPLCVETVALVAIHQALEGAVITPGVELDAQQIARHVWAMREKFDERGRRLAGLTKVSTDTAIGQMQQVVYSAARKAVEAHLGPGSADCIDGAGSDGDEYEFTAAEVAQAIHLVGNVLDEERGQHRAREEAVASCYADLAAVQAVLDGEVDPPVEEGEVAAGVLALRHERDGLRECSGADLRNHLAAILLDGATLDRLVDDDWLIDNVVGLRQNALSMMLWRGSVLDAHDALDALPTPPERAPHDGLVERIRKASETWAAERAERGAVAQQMEGSPVEPEGSAERLARVRHGQTVAGSYQEAGPRGLKATERQDFDHLRIDLRIVRNVLAGLEQEEPTDVRALVAWCGRQLERSEGRMCRVALCGCGGVPHAV